jgi:hypothetical protein
MLLLSDGYWGSDILDVFEDEDRVLFGVFELLEKQERFLVIA